MDYKNARRTFTVRNRIRRNGKKRDWEVQMSEMLGRRRSGWLTFAGVIALIAGFYNGLSGIAH